MPRLNDCGVVGASVRRERSHEADCITLEAGLDDERLAVVAKVGLDRGLPGRIVAQQQPFRPDVIRALLREKDTRS